jgi:hypothetical protein
MSIIKLNKKLRHSIRNQKNLELVEIYRCCIKEAKARFDREKREIEEEKKTRIERRQSEKCQRKKMQREIELETDMYGNKLPSFKKRFEIPNASKCPKVKSSKNRKIFQYEPPDRTPLEYDFNNKHIENKKAEKDKNKIIEIQISKRKISLSAYLERKKHNTEQFPKSTEHLKHNTSGSTFLMEHDEDVISISASSEELENSILPEACLFPISPEPLTPEPIRIECEELEQEQSEADCYT